MFCFQGPSGNTGGSLFSNTNTGSSGLFGNTNTGNNTGNSLFGNTNTNNTNTNQAELKIIYYRGYAKVTNLRDISLTKILG